MGLFAKGVVADQRGNGKSHRSLKWVPRPLNPSDSSCSRALNSVLSNISSSHGGEVESSCNFLCLTTVPVEPEVGRGFESFMGIGLMLLESCSLTQRLRYDGVTGVEFLGVGSGKLDSVEPLLKDQEDPNLHQLNNLGCVVPDASSWRPLVEVDPAAGGGPSSLEISSPVDYASGEGWGVGDDSDLRVQENLNLVRRGCDQQDFLSSLPPFHPSGKGNFYLYPKFHSSLLVFALDLCRDHVCFEKSDFFIQECAKDELGPRVACGDWGKQLVCVTSNSLDMEGDMILDVGPLAIEECAFEFSSPEPCKLRAGPVGDTPNSCKDSNRLLVRGV